MRSESSVSVARKFDSLCVCQAKFSFLKLYQMTLFIIWTGTSFCQTEYSLHVLKYALKILNCVIQKAECKKHTSSFTITNQLKKSYQSVSD